MEKIKVTVRVRHPAGDHQNGAPGQGAGAAGRSLKAWCASPPSTAQMLDQVLEAFSITPDYDLDIMQPGQTLFGHHRPGARGPGGRHPGGEAGHGAGPRGHHHHLCRGFGLPTTARSPVGHVEAGLRTYDKYSPFPEEMNRQFVGCVADLHFAPTEGARQNLLREGKRRNPLWSPATRPSTPCKPPCGRTTPTRFCSGPRAPGSSCSPPTGGRTWASPCTGMFRAIRRVVEEFPDVKVVYPVHLNPLVQKAAEEELGGCDRVQLIAPLEVIEFHNLLARSYPHPHRQRRHPGGGALSGQAGDRPAGHHRAARGHRRRHA